MTTLKRIVIWGHELHSHTHSYIHNGFCRGFTHLGFETHWLPDRPQQDVDVENALIFAHNVACDHLPMSLSSYYVMHNVPCTPHPDHPDQLVPNSILETSVPPCGILKSHILTLQVFTKSCESYRPQEDSDGSGEFKEMIYTHPDPTVPAIFIPWATDLLPDEISENMRNLQKIRESATDNVHFVGMCFGPWAVVRQFCKLNRLKFKSLGGTFDTDSSRNVGILDNMKFIQQSLLAPAAQSKWQVDNWYIPCRIFKNISYGKMGVTNSEMVNKLFDNQLIYDPDIMTMMRKGLQFERNASTETSARILSLMEIVRQKHTYLNRCNAILQRVHALFDVSVEKG